MHLDSSHTLWWGNFIYAFAYFRFMQKNNFFLAEEILKVAEALAE